MCFALLGLTAEGRLAEVIPVASLHWGATLTLTLSLRERGPVAQSFSLFEYLKSKDSEFNLGSQLGSAGQGAKIAGKFLVRFGADWFRLVRILGGRGCCVVQIGSV